jgi:exodeoxyribonuclease VII small subunit
MAEKAKKKTFEQGLSRLDEIIALLEKDSVPLDELMKLYEEGVALVRDCNAQLDDAEQKVKMLQISADGTTARLVSFAGEEATND